MKGLLLVFVFVILAGETLLSENIRIAGRAVNAETEKPLISASVQLVDRDSTPLYHALTDRNGRFIIKNVKPGKYILKITYVGYIPFYKKLRITSEENFVKLRQLKIKPQDIQLEEVEVNAQSVIGEQHGDTTQFNAGSFKTTKDATVEELIKKMPGIEVEPDGKVKAQGEEVKKVFVDGKKFFGDDPSLALKNLPADVVDKVQIYDKSSEQAEFTGFDDGERSKALNIITKKSKRHGEFGKFSAGGGYDKKYQLNANYNIFNGPQRISILGMSNNVNQQNFSLIDILDMLGSRRGRMLRRYISSGAGAAISGRINYAVQRSGASTFYGGLQEGISTTHALGVNYSDVWSDNLEVSGSYFFNYGDNNNDQLTNRDFLFSKDSTKYYNENDNSNTINTNHRFNLRLDWDLDTNTSFMWKPYATVQTNNNYSDAFSNTELISGDTSNASLSNYNSKYSGYDLSSILLFKHRLGKIGRTVSLNFTAGLSNREGSYNLLNDNFYLREGVLFRDTVNQTSRSPQDGYNLNGTISYTEPVHKDGQMLFSYKASMRRNNFDQRTYNFNYLTADFDLLDSLTSNIFDNDYLYQKGGAAYRYKTKDLYLSAGLDYQVAALQNSQFFPALNELDYRFYNFLPSLRFRYGKSKMNSIYVRFRTSTNSPSVSQLQNVVDNSNPLQLSTGNPALKQQLTNSLFMRYSNFSKDFTKMFFVFLSLRNTWDYIGTSSLLAERDTMITETLIVPAGAQLTRPVNLDGYWSAFGMLSYGFPLGFMKSKLNTNIGGNYMRRPGLVNGLMNYSNLYNYYAMLMLTSNVSENLDFNFTSKINFNNTINTIQKNNNLNYFSVMNIANFKWIFWEGFFLQGDVRNVVNGGEYQPENGNYTLVNFAIGKKFFKDEAGELKLYVFDILNMNKSIQTNLTDFYTENVYNTVLERYIMLTFTYRLRNFGGRM
jgi:hypothetical protein